MKLLLAGPPACGKGSYGQILSEDYGLPLISSGQILRDLPPSHPRYQENKDVMNSGGLSPDDLVAQIVSERLTEEDCKDGYILDGYGRRLNQVKLFEPALDRVIYIEIPESETLRRITGRRICDADDKVYNIYTLPPEEIKACKGNLIQRDDDKEEVVLKRLEFHKNETMPMIDYFKNKKMVSLIDGMGTIDEVYSRIIQELKRLGILSFS